MIVFVQTKWVTAVIAMRSQVTFYLQVRTCSCLVSMIYLHISELVRTKNSEILRKFMLKLGVFKIIKRIAYAILRILNFDWMIGNGKYIRVID